MKSTLLSLAAFLLSPLASAPAFAQTPRAIAISIFGIGPAVDSQAVAAVRRVIGTAVTKGTIDHYITYGYGIEGGTSSCIQLSRFEEDKTLQQLERELLQIQPNPATTSYNVETVATCNQEANAIPREQLADTQWRIVDLGGTSIIDNVPAPTLQFAGTTRIQGQGGCNQYSADAQFEDAQLTIANLIATKRACVDSQVQKQENQYFRALENAQRVSLEGTELLIYSDGFDKPLRFLPLSDSN